MTKADIILDCACVKLLEIFFYLALILFCILVMANSKKLPIWDYLTVKVDVHYAECNTT